MTPEPAPSCFEKTRILTELQEAVATLMLLCNREIEVVASGTKIEIAGLDSNIQTAKARREALELAYEKHVAEHGC